MTALKRAESIVTRYTPSGHDSLRDAIHLAIIEHAAEAEARARALRKALEWCQKYIRHLNVTYQGDAYQEERDEQYRATEWVRGRGIERALEGGNGA